MKTFLRDRYRRSGKPIQPFSTLVQKARDVVWDPPSALRKALESGVLTQNRGQEFTLCSDRDLRDALHHLQQNARLRVSDEVLPIVFAIVNEAIKRRLGAWRIFGPSTNVQGLAVYQDAATQIMRSANYKTMMGYYIDEDFWESESFNQSLMPVLAKMDLDGDEQTIIKTIVYVTETSKIRHQSNILLPSKFYQALATKDTEDVLGFHITDEQVLSGTLLYQGNIVQLNSGEGKTVAAAFPAVLHAILGNSVHIITANDYLAARDSELLGPVYESLALTVDAVLSYLSDEERRDAYTKQIVYGTIREFGFDFLRDNLKVSSDERVQRPLEVAIVDEVDHALIDEESTPMIIAGKSTGTRRAFGKVKNAVQELITLQIKVARNLEDQLPGAHQSPTNLYPLLAKLLLAQHDNGALRQLFADNPQQYKRVQVLIDQDKADYPNSALTADLYYVADPRGRYVTLTERGLDFLETRLGRTFDAQSIEQAIASLARNKRMPLAERRKAHAKLTRQLLRHYNLGNQVYQMLRAYLLLKKNVDYGVTEDSIVLIDRSTGRPRPDSRYQQGLQAALEAKEGVTIQPECEVLAQVSVRGFVSQYRKLAGMTGTTQGARDGFLRAYGLDVAMVPPNHQFMRVDLGHKVYVTRQDKLSAIADEVIFSQQVGRPVLVGTLTVEQSEEISSLLTKRGVRHSLLNAVNCHEEAQIVKQAGAAGAVTVATNMAGRGTDIVLDPNLSSVIAGRYRDLVHRLLSQDVGCVVLDCHKEEADILWSVLSSSGLLSLDREKHGDIEKLRVTSRNGKRRDDRSVCLDFGLGLYVIGTELNHSERIDLQLRGRSGRQGEFGLSQFFLSMEDQVFIDRENIASYPANARKLDSSGQPYFEGNAVDRQIKRVQGTIELEKEAQRCLIQDYASILDSQTILYYRARREVMESSSFRNQCVTFARGRARQIVDQYFPQDIISDYRPGFDSMVEELQEDYQIDCSSLRGCELDWLAEKVGDLLVASLEQIESRLDEKRFTKLAKLLLLRTGDELWRDHVCGLQELMLSTQQGAHSHNAALSEYTIRAFKEWRAFRERVVSVWLSRLMTFPVSDIAAQPVLEGQLLIEDLAEDIALVLI